MRRKRSIWWLLGLLFSASLALGLSGCGAPIGEQAGQASPAARAQTPSPATTRAGTLLESVLQTPAAAAQSQTVAESVVQTPAPPSPKPEGVTLPVWPTPTRPPRTTAIPPRPTAAPTLAVAGVPLVVLHTNDVWGETEPCG